MGVGRDDGASHDAFRAARGLDVISASDLDGAVSETHGARGWGKDAGRDLHRHGPLEPDRGDGVIGAAFASRGTSAGRSRPPRRSETADPPPSMRGDLPIRARRACVDATIARGRPHELVGPWGPLYHSDPGPEGARQTPSTTGPQTTGDIQHVRSTLARRLAASLERRLPERRVFIRSDDGTRYVRLRPSTQILLWTGAGATLAWSILATAVLVMDGVGSGSLREHSQREQALYEARLEALAAERDARASDAAAAQERFAAVLTRVSAMQARLLEAEGRLMEADTGLEVVQATLRRTMRERDAARTELVALTGEGDVESATASLREADATVDLLTAALDDAARQRDGLIGEVADREAQVARLALDARLARERTDRIFGQLEEAVSISIEPLERMFSAAGVPPDDVIAAVRRGHSGQGGPLEPIAAAAGAVPVAAADTARANAILGALGEMNHYRLAAARLPFANPVPSGAYRLTSGFGPRRDPMGRGTRMHSGMDFAGAKGTPIHATADGTVVRAGWMRGYGKTIDIQHAFGILTRYAHLSSIDVAKGQRISRGERIGGMGTTGRSTGVHLHYEVHADGEPVNPMTYIKAASDVF